MQALTEAMDRGDPAGPTFLGHLVEVYPLSATVYSLEAPLCRAYVRDHVP